MCHSLSMGTGNGVDMSIRAAVAFKDKVRLSLQGRLVLGLMCRFDVSLHYTGSEQQRSTAEEKGR